MIVKERDQTPDAGVEVLGTPRGSVVTFCEDDSLQHGKSRETEAATGSIDDARGAKEEEEAPSPISNFRGNEPRDGNSTVDSDDLPASSPPLLPELPEDDTFSRSRDEPATYDSFPGWNKRIDAEIEEAKKASSSVISDPTGLDERMDRILQGALTATRNYIDPRDRLRTTNELIGLASVEINPRFEDYDDGDSERRPGHPAYLQSLQDEEMPVSSDFLPMPFSDDDQSSCSDDRMRLGPQQPAHENQTDNSNLLESIKGTRGAENGISDGVSPPYTQSNEVARRVERIEGDEKKDGHVSSRKASFSSNLRDRLEKDDIRMVRSLSMTESDVGSVDGLPSAVRSRLQDETHREMILKSLDGIQDPPGEKEGNRNIQFSSEQPVQAAEGSETSFRGWPFNLIWPGGNDRDGGRATRGRLWGDQHDDTFALLGCADIIHHREERPPVATSLIRVSNEPPPPAFAETIRRAEVDPRMQDWIDRQFVLRDLPPEDGNFYLGTSRIVVVHEIHRGDWTWCTAWSPDGKFLALATENHRISVVDASSSTVWRIQHDQKLTGSIKNDSTRSIRSIAWGEKYIAISGTGTAVALLAPLAPYSLLHEISETGFVGDLDWRPDSSILAIASRLKKAMIVRVETCIDSAGREQIKSELIHSIECNNWVNCVAFSPGGNCLAVGDAGGTVSVYNYTEMPNETVSIDLIKSFAAEDSILDIEWSPEGKYLYAGGEDFKISIIDTNYWEVVHKQDRQRWVQCIAASHGGTHMAVGGDSSEISLLDVNCGWESTMGIELKGLVPLSAAWHPKDQYLALTGQSDSVLVVETTNARHVSGHHLHSVSPVLAVEFSPDGRMAVVGNKSGIVTFFSLTGSTFETAYELVVLASNGISTAWSANGQFIVVGSEDVLTIVGRGPTTYAHIQQSPPKTSGFSIRKVLRDFGAINAVAVDSQSHYVAVSGKKTWILDSTSNFAVVLEWGNGTCLANSWSPDGCWLATIGTKRMLTVYQTGDSRVERWQPIFRLDCNANGRALAWGPIIRSGLLYLAFGGDSNEITIMEIRAFEGTWETVLRIPRDGPINALDWTSDGLLAAAIGNGTVTIVDLSYLQSGVAVNEMDYNWQRQALTCFTELRRNRGRNSMSAVRWIPSAPGSDSLLAVGGTDGEIEIVDLTERKRCRGYNQSAD